MNTVRALAAVACLCPLALAGCQQVTFPDGRVGYSISPANLASPGQGGPTQVRRGEEANDPYVQSVVPDQAIFSAEPKFYEIGLYNLPRTLERCVAEARRRRGNVPECWALDIHAMMVNVAQMNVRHRPGVPGLDPDSARRRWHIYAESLGVAPDRYQLVQDGTFQRVFAVSTAQR